MSADLDDGVETVAEMATALAAGDVTSAELAERALLRLEIWQPITNAFSQVWSAEAMAAAAHADAARRRGEHPLAGIPIAVKDLFDVTGQPTTGCSAAYAGRVARRDATTIDRVRRAGLVMIGKTNQHELAAGGTNLASACGPTRNPWAPAHMTGGSSGGSAAAVACGVVPWALGSDTGGSIRIPSSFCGTVGLKPTTGAIETDGMLPLAPSMDCPGPIAATVEDAWLLHRVLAGGRVEMPAREWLLRRPAEPFRIGVPDGYFADNAHDDVRRAVEATADVLSGAGMVVRPVDGHGIDDQRHVWSDVCFAEFAESHPALRDPILRARLAPQVRSWIERGEAVSERDRRHATYRRAEIARWFRERLSGVDALLIPTTPYAAPGAEQDEVRLSADVVVRVAEVGPGYLTSSINLAGLPAISVPGGWTAGGLPIGVTLVGNADDDELVARIAARWQDASGHQPQRPGIAGRSD
jgi:aspartyl-tRNA(Asn)/glutamyl-tRNA(Gln) amidotransferase subunit A